MANGQAGEPRPWPKPPLGDPVRASVAATVGAEQPVAPQDVRVLMSSGTAPPHVATLAEAVAAAKAEHQAAVRSSSAPMQAFVLEGSASSDDDDGADDEPSVREQLLEIAQMLRTMQFDITTLKRVNRRQ